MAHRWLRSSKYSGGGGSTYVEWPTRQAKWGVRELIDEAGQREGGAPVQCGGAWRRSELRWMTVAGDKSWSTVEAR
jgi:hypothetical protein